MKTITISNEIYDKLVTLKGDKTFNAILNDLIQKNVEKRIEMLIENLEPSGHEEELNKISLSIRSGFKVRE
jgi:predicted CopG family antitoxin